MPFAPCIIQDSPEKQNQQEIFICLLWGIGSQIMEPGSPTICCLQILETQSESKALRTRGADGVNPSLRQDEMGYPTEFLLPPPSVLFRPSTYWMMPTLIGKGSKLYQVHKFKCQSHWETLSQTHLETMFNLSIPWSVKLTHKINQHPPLLLCHSFHPTTCNVAWELEL